MITPALMYELETEILKELIKQLTTGNEYSAKWQMEKLSELGALNTKVQKIIDNYSARIEAGTYADIDQAAKDAFSQIRAQIPEGREIVMTPGMEQSINNWIQSAETNVNLSMAKMAESASSEYVYALNKANLQVVTGQSTITEAVKQVVTETINQGLPAFTDTAGREWSPEGYVQMVIRSNQSRASQQMMRDIGRQLGTDLYSISFHAGSRPSHYAFQNKIYSMTGNTPGHDNISVTGYGTAGGIGGINCMHLIYPWIPGMPEPGKTPITESQNEKQYEESQTQRKLERSIRDAKRKEILYNTEGDTVKTSHYKQRVRDLQAKMRQFIDDTGRTRRYDREQVYQ